MYSNLYVDCYTIQWHAVLCTGTAGTGRNDDWHTVKQQNKQLKEENNLLKIKIELLLDMVSFQLT